MRRRDLIAMLGGAAAAWPLGGRAQPVPGPVVGWLSARSPDDSENLMAAFREGLQEGGYVEGRNVAIEYRWALGQYDRLPALAAELVSRQVSVIATLGGEPAAVAAKAATAKVPIVFSIGGDPVKLGLVASLGRPGGNVTGVSILATSLDAKRFELLHELVPKAAVVAVLFNPRLQLAEARLKAIEDAARSEGQAITVFNASDDRELENAFAAIAQHPTAALLVAGDPFFDTRRNRIAASAAQCRVPAMYQLREYAMAGGLMSYGTDLADAYRQVGVYVGRILKGARPADPPVMQSTKFELVINLKTAKALGLAIPPALLARADAVIE
jgi:putative tryptophan/tyrosine transport system substrate-binding protein